MQTIPSGFKTYTGFYAIYNQLKKQLPCVGQKGGILMEKIFQSISGNNTLMYKKSLFLASLCGSVFNSNSYNKEKNLPYLSICQEIYFSFKHHTPGVYGNHKTSHSDEEAEAISSAINIFNFCLQRERKLKSFLNLNPKCCLIVHIWLRLVRRNNSLLVSAVHSVTH